MYGLGGVALALVFVATAMFARQETQLDVRVEAANAVSMNMRVYVSNLKTYLTANPTASGTISDASLGLPSWYTNLGWTNSVGGGTAVVYASSMNTLRGNPTIGWKMIEEEDSYSAGIKKSGQFFSPRYGVNASITVPAGAPENSPLYVVTAE